MTMVLLRPLPAEIKGCSAGAGGGCGLSYLQSGFRDTEGVVRTGSG